MCVCVCVYLCVFMCVALTNIFSSLTFEGKAKELRTEWAKYEVKILERMALGLITLRDKSRGSLKVGVWNFLVVYDQMSLEQQIL